MELYLPPSIASYVGKKAAAPETVGMSGAEVLCFDDMVLKIEPQSEEADSERAMLRFLAGKLPVPRILAAEKANGLSYLLMTRLPGEMACARACLADLAGLAALLAEGLRMLSRVDISECPRSAMLDEKLRLAEIRVRNGLCDVEDVEPGTYGPGGFASPADLLAWLRANRPEETPAFAHGDYCLPNVFIENGRISGFLDLGRSGAADPYQDIALCCRSLHHNYSGRYGGKPMPGFGPDMLFDALGIKPDREKIRYYILLDELF